MSVLSSFEVFFLKPNSFVGFFSPRALFTVLSLHKFFVSTSFVDIGIVELCFCTCMSSAFTTTKSWSGNVFNSSV